MTDILRVGNLDVSRETFERLKIYQALLEKWNPAINLVAPGTLADAWDRHFVDSAQVFQIADLKTGHWVDLGSGGGFPGMVCAVLSAELAPEIRFTMVESDKRKCAFLNTVARDVGIQVEVVANRVEAIPQMDADIISARALADLNTLISWSKPHLREGGRCLFPKGRKFSEEIIAAKQFWRFMLTEKESITSSEASILVLGDIERV